MANRGTRVELWVKRAYEAASGDDGRRVLVDRLWPRGISRDKLRADAWVKEVAPSDGLRRWFGHDPARWDGFRERYFRELDNNGEALETLYAQLRGVKRATLLYGAHDERHNNAVALLEYLQKAR